MTAKTDKERKSAERQRKQTAGLQRLELSGVHPDDTAELRRYASLLAAARLAAAHADAEKKA